MVNKSILLSLLLFSTSLIAHNAELSLDVPFCDSDSNITRKNCCSRCPQGEKGDQGMPGTPLSTSYFFAFRTTALDGTGDTTFEDVSLTLSLTKGWTTNGVDFVCPESGIYLISWSMSTVTTINSLSTRNNAVGIVTLNNPLDTIPGSQMGVRFPDNVSPNDGRNMDKSFIVALTKGDMIRLRFATSSVGFDHIALAPIGNTSGVSLPVSATLAAIRINNLPS